MQSMMSSINLSQKIQIWKILIFNIHKKINDENSQFYSVIFCFQEFCGFSYLKEKWHLVDDMKRNSSVDDIYFRMEKAINFMLEQGCQAIGSFIFGIIACYIFYKTRNIYYSIFLHFIYNFSYYFLKYFGADFHNYFISIKYNLTYWLIVTLGITFLIGGLELFNKYTKETNLKPETWNS